MRGSGVVARLDELRVRVTQGPGELERSVRAAAASGSAVPAEAKNYVEKIRRHAYKVTDEDVAALRAAGWTEDEIFELTVATAMHEGLYRWSRAAEVLEEART